MKYTVIRNRYLANGLAFCGFHYQKYNDNEKTVFSFKETEELQNAIHTINQLRVSNNK